MGAERLLQRGGVLRGVLVAGLTLPMLGAVDASTLRRRYEEVARMPALEREQTQRNFDAFRELAADQRAEIREIHAAVGADPQAAALVQTFHYWLRTLTRSQRDELRRETDPFKRMQLVRKYKQEQDRQLEGDPASPGPGGGPPRFSRERGPTLSEAELTAIVNQVYESLPASLRRDAGQPPWKPRDYRRVIELAQRQAGREHRWPKEEDLAALIELITQPDVRREIEKKAGYDERRGEFAGQFFKGLRRLIGEEIRRQWPTDAQLQEYFIGLDSEQRDQLMQLSPFDSHRRLVGMYIEHTPSLRELLEQSGGPGDGRGRGDGGRGRGGPGGPGGPGGSFGGPPGPPPGGPPRDGPPTEGRPDDRPGPPPPRPGEEPPDGQ